LWRSAAGGNDKAWTREKHDVPAILSKSDPDLKQRYGTGTDKEIEDLTNPECRRMLILCGVPDNLAKRKTLSQRHDVLKRFRQQLKSNDIQKPETPRFTRKKVQPPSTDSAVLQREFEAELSQFDVADEEDAPDGSNAEMEEFGKDLEEEFGEDFLGDAPPAAQPAPKRASNSNRSRTVVMRILSFTNPDGSRWQRKELITDPGEVKRYIAGKKKEEQARAERSRKYQERKIQLSHARSKRKIHKGEKTEEQVRQDSEKKVLQKQEAFLKYKEWVAGGQVGSCHIGTAKADGKACSKCGCTGHMRTNAICPLYEGEPNGGRRKKPQARAADPKKQAVGTSLTMSKRTAGSLKMKISGQKRKEAKQAKSDRRKKSQYMDEGADLYKPRASKSRGGHQRGTAYGRWCELLEKQVLDVLWSEDCAQLFQNPVSKKDAPDYSKTIKNPICLRQIKDKMRKFVYINHRQFEGDMDLLVQNCRTYNTAPASLWLVESAEKLKAKYIELMQMHTVELTQLVGQIDQESSAPSAAMAAQNASGMSPGYSPQTMANSVSPSFSGSMSTGSPGSRSPASSTGLSLSPSYSPSYSPLYSPTMAVPEDGGGVYSEDETPVGGDSAQ
jgi:hypothetical protein